MLGALIDLMMRPLRAATRNAAISAASGFVALSLALMGVAGLLVSLFFALDPTYGAACAALAVSGLAFVLAVAASIPLWVGKRRPPPPPLAAEVGLAELAALAGKTTSGLSLRQIVLAAALIGLAIGVKAATAPKAK